MICNKNLIAFSGFIAALIAMGWFCNLHSFPPADEPWQLMPFTPEDSLSQFYKENYRVYDEEPIAEHLKSVEKQKVFILVDAWGVSIVDSILVNDFSIFGGDKHAFGLHKRTLNQTAHAEQVELRQIGFKGEILHGDDKVIADKLDSLLSAGTEEDVAWTTQSSREGQRDALHETLSYIANLAKKYPESLFIVMGTHRPILGTPETRRLYHPHWVPVVILNE